MFSCISQGHTRHFFNSNDSWVVEQCPLNFSAFLSAKPFNLPLCIELFAVCLVTKSLIESLLEGQRTHVVNISCVEILCQLSCKYTVYQGFPHHSMSWIFHELDEFPPNNPKIELLCEPSIRNLHVYVLKLSKQTTSISLRSKLKYPRRSIVILSHWKSTYILVLRAGCYSDSIPLVYTSRLFKKVFFTPFFVQWSEFLKSRRFNRN